jgi:hypothetical protein
MVKLFKQRNQDSNRQWNQAMADYWPIFPVFLILIITASALVGPPRQTPRTTANSFNLVVCDVSELPPEVDLDGDYYIEMTTKASNKSVSIPVTVKVTGDCSVGDAAPG